MPTGYIYPKAQRAIRDLLRRRLSLVRSASAQLISVQSQIWRSAGIRIKSDTLRKPDFKPSLLDGYTLQATNAGLTVYAAIKKEMKRQRQSRHKYLSWAFSEAAHFSVRFEPLAQRFYERKKAKTNGIIAIRAVARKLARITFRPSRELYRVWTVKVEP
ncbi:MAG TPA: hypothetical protein PKM20_02980 [Nitrosomonas sp.]|nr:hypothetical protein [Nitrosomonas sp.]